MRQRGPTVKQQTAGNERPFYHGWIIVAICTILLSTTLGICYSFGVFFSSLQDEFGWSRGTTSSIFSVYLLLAGVFSVAGGWATDRYGPRRIVITMAIVTAISLLLTSRVEAAWQLYLTYGVLLSLGTGSMYTIVMSTGARWFIRKRATAIGIIGSGAALGTVVVAPFSAWLITTFNWREAYMVLGFATLAIMFPLAIFLRKEPIENRSLPLRGSENRPVIEKNIEPSMRESLSTLNFWLFFLVWFAYSFCLHLVMSHVVRGAEDLGVTSMKAASVLSVLTAVTVPARLLSGVISDRIDKKTIGIVTALLHASAMFWLADSDQLWQFYLFAVLYGIAYGAIDPPVTSLIGDTFGTRSVGAVMGILMLAWGLGSAAGPYFGGALFDYTGNYRFAFFCGGLIMVFTACFIWAIGRKRPEY